ncbi:MAG: hypothetical protein ACTTHY_07145 [Prevotella intermedia]
MGGVTASVPVAILFTDLSYRFVFRAAAVGTSPPLLLMLLRNESQERAWLFNLLGVMVIW